MWSHSVPIGCLAGRGHGWPALPVASCKHERRLLGLRDAERLGPGQYDRQRGESGELLRGRLCRDAVCEFYNTVQTPRKQQGNGLVVLIYIFVELGFGFYFSGYFSRSEPCPRAFRRFPP